ncbi:MAG: cytochrome c biogenesis protein CcdA [Clostridia bacterium]|nr:cytochrome c biogenesis protein CcdA [Clostridia bacterium]
MQYIITFLEGLISFISPCMLPMLPVYISYFAGSGDKKHQVYARVACFILGFTLVFSALGLFTGTLGSLLLRYRTAVHVVSGLLVIFFGLAYLEVIPLPFLRGMQGGYSAGTMVSAFLFGVVYSVSLTPCVGAFLGSALMMASSAGTAGKGVLLLVTYSLGLGVPFMLSAVLLDRLGKAFGWIKSHYRIINLVCGGFLILVGVLMMFGWLDAVLTRLM